MKTANLFFNSFTKPIGKEFVKDCTKQNICSTTIKQGKVRNRRSGWHDYQWIETERPNYRNYLQALDQGLMIEVFFYTEEDRKDFLKKIQEKIKVTVVNSFKAVSYYEMNVLYELELKKA